jgi:hypothetical protein
MAKDPNERYQTASEVAEILADQLGALRNPPPPTSATTVIRRPPKAHRLGQNFLVLLGMAALALGLLAWWVMHSGNSERAPRTRVAHRSVESLAPVPPPPPTPHPAAKTHPRDTESVEVVLARAADAAKAGDLERAIELYGDAIRRAPTNVDALLARLRLHA